MSRFTVLAFALSLTLVNSVSAQDADGSVEPVPLMEQMAESSKELREKVKAMLVRSSKIRDAKIAAELERIADKRRQLEQLLSEEGAFQSNDAIIEEGIHEPAEPLALHDKSIDGKLPAVTDAYFISSGDFNLITYKPWSLKKSDVRIWRPERVVVKRPFAAATHTVVHNMVEQTERKVATDVFFAIPFAITNSSPEPRSICPTITIASENLRFTQETGGFLLHKDIEKSMGMGLKSMRELLSYKEDFPEGKLMQVFEAGQTHYGVAIFAMPDIEMDRMTIMIEGLGNVYRFDRKQKRVLVIEYDMPGDIVYPDQDPITFRSKDWQWQWMWYEEIKVEPIEAFEFKTITQERTKKLWAFTATVKNSTQEVQELEIRTINTIARVNVMGVNVDVPIVDDGKSTIHKVKVLDELGETFKGERFIKGKLEVGDEFTFPVILDRDDIDWESVYSQVSQGLLWDFERNRGIAVGYGEGVLKPGLASFIPSPEDIERIGDKIQAAKLDDEKKKQIRAEVLEKLEDAMDNDKSKKMLTLDVTGVSGFVSDVYRIRPSYYKPGVIDPSWIHSWEE